MVLKIAKSGYKLFRFEDIKTFYVQKRFQKSCSLQDNIEKHGKFGHATDGNIIRRMRIACWIPKVTDTDFEYVVWVVVLAVSEALNVSLTQNVNKLFLWFLPVRSFHSNTLMLLADSVRE